MTPLLCIAALASLAGVGFAVLIQASPFGLLPYKPWACRTCLSGWGAIATCTVLLSLYRPDGGPVSILFLWAVLSFAGTGGAHLIMGLVDGPGAGAPTGPMFFDDPGGDGGETFADA